MLAEDSSRRLTFSSCSIIPHREDKISNEQQLIANENIETKRFLAQKFPKRTRAMPSTHLRITIGSSVVLTRAHSSSSDTSFSYSSVFAFIHRTNCAALTFPAACFAKSLRRRSKSFAS